MNKKMKIEIEKGIELFPRGPRKKEDPIRDALKSMEVGDSFFIPAAEVGKSYQSYVIQRAEKYDIKVTTRRAEKDGVKGFRVWRKR